MYQNFRLVGVSYRTSCINIREKLSFDEEENRSLIVRFKEIFGFEDILVLSTCNRTEIYYSSPQDLDDKIISIVCFQKGIEMEEVSSDFKTLQGIEAVRHLYNVTLGLDAKVLGDIQISNQVKRAYQCAADEGTASPFLHRLMHSILFANKQVVQETAFRDGVASTSYASVELVKQIAGNFRHPNILILGLGEIGSDVVDNLKGIDAEVTLANRTIKKADKLAEAYGFGVLDIETALEQVANYDIIVSSIRTSTPVIRSGHFDKTSVKQKLLIDLSVPRSISPGIEKVPGIILYNIDQLEEKTQDTLTRRRAAIPAVEAIRDTAIEEFKTWDKEMMVSPAIQKFKEALEDIRNKELARYLKKADAEQAKLLDKVTKGIIQKVIKLPAIQLKAACKRGEAETLVDVLNDLFDLDRKKVQEKS